MKLVKTHEHTAALPLPLPSLHFLFERLATFWWMDKYQPHCWPSFEDQSLIICFHGSRESSDLLRVVTRYVPGMGRDLVSMVSFYHLVCRLRSSIFPSFFGIDGGKDIVWAESRRAFLILVSTVNHTREVVWSASLMSEEYYIEYRRFWRQSTVALL